MKMIPICVDCWYDGKRMASPDDNKNLYQFLQWLMYTDVGSSLAFQYNHADDNNHATITFTNTNNDSLTVPMVSQKDIAIMLFENSNKKTDSWKRVLRNIDSSLYEGLKDMLPNGGCEKLASFCVDRYLKIDPLTINPRLWNVCGIEWGGFRVTDETDCFIGDEYNRAELTIYIGLQPELASVYYGLAQKYQPRVFRELHPGCLYRKNDISLWEDDVLPLRALVEYKGSVYYDFAENELWMLEQQMIRDQEIQFPENGLCHPREMVPLIKPEGIYMDLPPANGLGDYMELLGLYKISKASEDEQKQFNKRTVYICQQTISRFAVMLLGRRDFYKKFRKTLQAIADIRGIDILDVLKEKITQIVELHELGHHVFRNLADKRQRNEREALANWFASLLLDPFDADLLEYMTQLQPTAYSDPLMIPTQGKLTKESYDHYCERLSALAWREDDA